jgi:hypothetical protein
VNNIGVSNFLIQNFPSSVDASLGNSANVDLTNVFGELLEKFNLPNILAVTESSGSEGGVNLIDTVSAKLHNDFDSNGFQFDISSQVSLGNIDVLEIVNESQFDINEAILKNEDIFRGDIKFFSEDNELAEIVFEEESYLSEEESGIAEVEVSPSHILPAQEHLNDNLDSEEKFREELSEELKVVDKKLPLNANFVLDEKENSNDSASFQEDGNEDQMKASEIFHEKGHLKKIELNPQKIALNYKKVEHMYDTKSVIEQLKVNLSKVTPESNKITIKLSPEELGSIEVVVDFDAQLIKDIKMKIEKVETYNLLQKDASNLKVALNGLGFEFADSALNFNLEQNDSKHNDQRYTENLYPEQELKDMDITDKIVTNYLPKNILGKVDILV